jgi:hypothetical protein
MSQYGKQILKREVARRTEERERMKQIREQIAQSEKTWYELKKAYDEAGHITKLRPMFGFGGLTVCERCGMTVNALLETAVSGSMRLPICEVRNIKELSRG